MQFVIHATGSGSRARLGTLSTRRGDVATPVFMPVGTRGTVRTQTRRQLEALRARGCGVLLANTYHLMQRPGAAVFARTALHEWMRWAGAVLTDSGGFQVFSLGARVDEAGAVLEGDVFLSPERAIAAQRAIGSDIRMVFDHCIASTCSIAEARDAMARTHRWAARSKVAHGGDAAALFAIVQGARFAELRTESADTLVGLGGFDGYAIGGLAVGESRAEREDMTEVVTARLPAARPRYMMGVGTPIDLLEGVHRGVDMFDCILPTAAAQHGHAFTSRGKLDLARTVHAASDGPLDPACDCEACAEYGRSYLHHLMKCREPLGWQLVATHNLIFYARLMQEIRAQLAAGTFESFYRRERAALAAHDLDHPPGRAPRVKARAATELGAYALEDGRVVPAVAEPPADLLAQLDLVQPRAVVIRDLEIARAAMIAIRWAEARGAALTIYAPAAGLDALRLALLHTGPFPHLRHAAPHVVASTGRYEAGEIRWTLVDELPPADLIIY